MEEIAEGLESLKWGKAMSIYEGTLSAGRASREKLMSRVLGGITS